MSTTQDILKNEEAKNRMNNVIITFFGFLATVTIGLMSWMLVTINTMSQDIAVIKANSNKDYEIITRSIQEIKEKINSLDTEMDNVRTFISYNKKER